MNGNSDDNGGDDEKKTLFIAPSGDSARPHVPLPSKPALSGAVQVGEGRPIQVGDVLNHIFEVKRFIARGGMGEVFEGENVNSDERVAIKVMLPALAADPNVQAMFRKEARTLTRLSHPALVQYRVLAQEPELGVFYIVTEFVDGQNLSDVLNDQNPTPQDLLDLIRRLAEGLKVAHALGAIHRDIAPDNVLLEGGKLAGAKIIDFGIAKDLDPGTATIVGDGFAGKLNYVAPEQLGDFNREVGPWTDVYSLGLVTLAIAMRRDVDMGGSLVDAVDKRRAGPDLFPAPEEVRPILQKMLAPNPLDRPRSMEEVIALLTMPSGTSLRKKIAKNQPAVAPAESNLGNFITQNRRMLTIAGGGSIFAILVATAIYLGVAGDVTPDTSTTETADLSTGSAAAPSASSLDPVTATRETLDAALPSVGCTWLNIEDISNSPQGITVALSGVAGKPAEAQGEIVRRLQSANIKISSIDFDDVSPIQSSECGPLEAFRQIRDPSGDRLSVAQRQFEMVKLADGEYAGQVGAQAIINFALGEAANEMSLFGLSPDGTIEQISPDRKTLVESTVKVGENGYRMTLDLNHAGSSGLLLLAGNKPFDGNLIAGPAGSRGPGWSERFLKIAKERNWKAEMVWFKTVDEQPN